MLISAPLKPKGKNTSAWQILKEILGIERTFFFNELYLFFHSKVKRCCKILTMAMM